MPLRAAIGGASRKNVAGSWPTGSANPLVRLEHGRRPVEQRAVTLRKGRERVWPADH
jgi:hypothetical protein